MHRTRGVSLQCLRSTVVLSDTLAFFSRPHYQQDFSEKLTRLPLEGRREKICGRGKGRQLLYLYASLPSLDCLIHALHVGVTEVRNRVGVALIMMATRCSR